MQSPPLEWTLFAAHFAALDYLRARGEADHDTASEVIRGYVERHPAGRPLFAVGLTVAAVGFYKHICRP